MYRHFPGGKDQLVNGTIVWEAGRFFERLAVAVADAPDLETLLIDAVMFAHRAFEEHAVLQKVLETEPDLLLPQLTVESTRLLAFIRNFLVGRSSGPDPGSRPGSTSTGRPTTSPAWFSTS